MFGKQKVCKMNDFDAVFDAGVHLVKGHNIFGVMIAELHQVPHLAVRCFWDPDADLHINALVAARCNKVDLLCIVLADVNLWSSRWFRLYPLFVGKPGTNQ